MKRFLIIAFLLLLTAAAFGTARVCTFDSQGRLLVDGVKTPVLAAYTDTNQETSSWLSTYFAKTKFNIVVSYGSNEYNKSTLDTFMTNADNLGLMVILDANCAYPTVAVAGCTPFDADIPGCSRTSMSGLTLGHNDQTSYTNVFESEVDTYKTNHALLGWYIGDELDISCSPIKTLFDANCAYVHGNDSNHILWNSTTWYRTSMYGSTEKSAFDVWSTDIYPWRNYEVVKAAGYTCGYPASAKSNSCGYPGQLSQNSAEMDQMRSAFSKPHWIELECSTQEAWNSACSTSPSYNVMLQQVFQDLAHGARGFVLYSFYHPYDDGNFTQQWPEISALGDTLYGLSDVMLGDYHSGDTSTVTMADTTGSTGVTLDCITSISTATSSAYVVMNNPWDVSHNYTFTLGSALTGYSSALDMTPGRTQTAIPITSSQFKVTVESGSTTSNHTQATSGFRLYKLQRSVDTTPPIVSISVPTSQTSSSTTSSSLSISGTASDNVAVSSVAWANVTTSATGSCTGTTAWSANGISLNEGLNTIIVSATDSSNNVGTATLSVIYTPQPSFPVLTDGPYGMNSCPGGAFTTTVTATGATSYQWWFNPFSKRYAPSWSPISGATSSTYNVPSVSTSDVGSYKCVISNSAGSLTSSNANFRLASAPNVPIQPAANTSSSNPTIKCSSANADSYIWQFQPIGGAYADVTAGTKYVEAVINGIYTLRINRYTTSDAGYYRCIFTNTCGTTTTSASYLY